MKNIVDDNFLQNKWKYIWQCVIVTFFVGIILVVFDFVVKLAIVTSLGATCFIVFTIPHRNSSKTVFILGGYTVGAVVGSICAIITSFTPGIPLSLWGAVAIGLSMFLMVVFNFEHPPAAALSLGIVFGGFNIGTIISVYSIAIMFLVVRKLLGKWLIDLI